MDDDFILGASVWNTPSDPIILPPPNKEKAAVIPPSPVSQFDDFDDFGPPAQSAPTEEVDDDFGDFGDFGEEEGDFGDVEFEDVRIPGPSRVDWEPLRLDPMPSREDLEKGVNEILGPIWGSEDISEVTTSEGIREVEGINQILVTPERYLRLHSDDSLCQSLRIL